MKSDQIIQALMGLLILILSGLFSWSLIRINALNERDADLNTQIALMQQTLDDIKENTEDDARQDEQLRKHWRIVSTHRDWINGLRMEHDLPLHTWPNLD
jgi:hypothetical protein